MPLSLPLSVALQHALRLRRPVHPQSHALVSTTFFVVAIRIWELGERQIGRGVLTEFLELPAGYMVEFIAVMSWVTAAGMITYGVYHIFKSNK